MITISPREFAAAKFLIYEGFPESKLIHATGSTILFYFYEWKAFWQSYHEHGQGD